MATYAIWNNKGGVGKSYLTFQLACEFARVHPTERVLVVDLCPQANSSGMLLGGMEAGEAVLENLSRQTPPRTISGYIEDRITSPYLDPHTGLRYVTGVSSKNRHVPRNVDLVAGDEQLEIQASRVLAATNPGPPDAWRSVHTWVTDLIEDIKGASGQGRTTVFLDCNPSFGIYTELALSAADRLIVPFSADGSSRRAVRAVLSLIYGITRRPGAQQSQYFNSAQRFRMRLPRIYSYVGNRVTQYIRSAKAFKTVVQEIGNEIWSVWSSNPNLFHVHPDGRSAPARRKDFEAMFQAEVPDANTASVVSTSLGIPIRVLPAGLKSVAGRQVMVNQSQLDRQQPAMRALAESIE